MQSATDKIQVFTPNEIARKIGGDRDDVLAVLAVCLTKATAAAFEWLIHGDHSKPWPFAKTSERGQMLVDIRTEQLCAKLHTVTIQPGDGGLSKDNLLRDIGLMLAQKILFDSRQFHRDEIARWLVDFGLQSEYRFSREAEPVPAPPPTPSATTPAPVEDVDTIHTSATIVKKAALVAALKHEWPSIEKDLSEATRNGLKAAAHTENHRCWDMDKARAWAVGKGKILQTAPVHSLAGAWSGQSRRHTISH